MQGKEAHMRHGEYWGSAILLVCGVVFSAACAAPTHARSSPTPTDTPLATYTMAPTSTPQAGLAVLPLPMTTIPLVPSPDGSLIAVIDTSQSSVTLYDTQGRAHGSYAMPAGTQPVAAWVSDSSGLLVWATYVTTNASGPLVLLDRQGHVVASGLNGANPAVSPDGNWIAYTHVPDNDSVGIVEVAPHNGGTARILAQNAIFLGWLNGRVAYFSQGNIYTTIPGGGGAALLAAAPGGDELRPPPSGPASSPDGQALVVMGSHSAPYVVSNALVGKPLPDALIFDPMSWAGSHAVLAGSNDVLIVDIITGAVVRDTGISIPGDIRTVSGDWILWTDTANAIHVVNFQTKAAHDTGPEPVQGSFLPLGSGRFILQGQGQAYIIDPSLAR